MTRLRATLLWLGAAVWALFVVAVSNSPSDVQHRTSGWLSLPLVRSLPAAILQFAASPLVLAASFFVVGAFLGRAITIWHLRAPKADEWGTFASELQSLAYQVDDARWSDDLHQLNADINVMRIKAQRKAFPFPSVENGFKTVEDLKPYLRQVATLLRAGELEHARTAAKILAAAPPPKRPGDAEWP